MADELSREELDALLGVMNPKPSAGVRREGAIPDTITGDRMVAEDPVQVIARGGKAWNQWRRENPGVVPRLVGAKLYAARLSDADLSGVDLSEANLHSARLVEADLRAAILRNACLVYARLMDARLEGADLSATAAEGRCRSRPHGRRRNLGAVLGGLDRGHSNGATPAGRGRRSQ